jgi:hypothetical protein
MLSTDVSSVQIDKQGISAATAHEDVSPMHSSSDSRMCLLVFLCLFLCRSTSSVTSAAATTHECAFPPFIVPVQIDKQRHFSSNDSRMFIDFSVSFLVQIDKQRHFSSSDSMLGYKYRDMLLQCTADGDWAGALRAYENMLKWGFKVNLVSHHSLRPCSQRSVTGIRSVKISKGVSLG